MLIEDWPIKRVRPYPNNPRVLKNAAEKIAESIKAFGWRQPIVVDGEGVIVAGHGRHAAAQLLKLKTVPVHVANDLTPDQVRALRVADNKTATFSEWDDGKLADELAEIMAGLGSVTFTGFSQSEFDALEMQARAEISRITGAGASADLSAPGFEPAALAEVHDPEPEQTGEATAPSDAPEVPPRVDLVPFNALMTVENRQVLYDAISLAKRNHSMETTADALLVIARSYIDA